jgi:large repetitive protein
MATSIRRPSARARFLSVLAIAAILAAAAILASGQVRAADATGCLATTKVMVGTAELTVTAKPLNALTEAQPFSSTVADLALNSAPDVSPSQPTFTVDWGDGTQSSATFTSINDLTATLSGGHTYAEEGPYTVTIAAHEVEGISFQVCEPVSVSDAPISLTAGSNLSVKEMRNTGIRQLATIQDTNPQPDPADFPQASAATVDWGDGASGPGSVIDGAVSGAHVFAKPGSYPVKVTVVDSGGSTATTTLTATVTATLIGTGKTLTATEGIPMPPPHDGMAGPVIASFTDQLLQSTSAGNFQASITWGDSTAATAGTVVSTGRDGEENPTFDVQGAHQFAEEGTYTAVVTLRDELGRTGTASSTITVSDAALAAAAGSAISALKANSTGTLVLATFSDANLAAGVNDFTASIDWGDGTTASAGTVGAGTTAAHFTVSGSHTYAAAGTFSVKVTITDHANQATASVTATVTAPAVLAATGQRWPIDPEFSWNLGIALLLLGLAVLAWGRFVRGRYVWRSRP